MYKDPILVERYSSFGPTSDWYVHSLTVLEFILRFLRMDYKNLLALDDVCYMYWFQFRSEDIVVPKYLAECTDSRILPCML